MTNMYMDNDDIYQLFIEYNVKGVRREAGRCFLGVNMGDAGVIGEAMQARVAPSAGQRFLQAGEPGPQAGEAAPQAEPQAEPPAEQALQAAPLAAPLEQESVPKAWPVLSQDLRDVDLEIQLADRKLALKRKHCEMSDLEHQQSEQQEQAKLKLAEDQLKLAEDQLKLAEDQLKLAEDQLKLERLKFELRKEQEQWDIARQTQLFELELKRKQA
jgi:hypothetical protein